MKLNPCPRGSEVRELLHSGGWPQAAPADLTAHAAACGSCAQLVLLTQSFRSERAHAVAAARPGSPGALWWRAQLRRRNAAMERISRPVAGAELFALVINLLAVIGLLGWQARNGLAWLTWLEALPQASRLHLAGLIPFALPSSLSGLGWVPILMFAGFATLLLIGGAAIHAVAEKEKR